METLRTLASHGIGDGPRQPEFGPSLPASCGGELLTRACVVPPQHCVTARKFLLETPSARPGFLAKLTFLLLPESECQYGKALSLVCRVLFTLLGRRSVT